MTHYYPVGQSTSCSYEDVSLNGIQDCEYYSWKDNVLTTKAQWNQDDGKQWAHPVQLGVKVPQEQKQLPLMFPPWLDQLVERIEEEKKKKSVSEASSTCSSPCSMSSEGMEHEKRMVWEMRRRARMQQRSSSSASSSSSDSNNSC